MGLPLLAGTLVVRLLAALVAAQALAAPARAERATRTISIVGTNDLHGYVFPAAGRGGLAWFGGFVRNLRAARQQDPVPGGVVLLDAGDTFQGGIESNLSEGSLVVDAYNALGYAAAPLGNHEFDFGPLDAFDPADNPDPRGAIKAIAARSRYPVLAANLLDADTGRRVDWPNVSASTLVTVAGVRVGIIGAMTIEGLRATLAANVHGLRLAPLTPVVRQEAEALRARGADLVILTIHAGGYCAQVTDPHDVSGCDSSAELIRLLSELPPATLDAVVAGHTHSAIAHLVNDVPVIESLWGGRAFGRIDLRLDAETHRVRDVRVFPTQHLCTTGDCAHALGLPAGPGDYEGQPVAEDDSIVRAMAPELARVRQRQAELLPVTVDTLMRRGTSPGASLGNLFADALREATPGAEVAVNNNGFAGLRADLPAGPLTFGRLYDVFPFDNRVVQFQLTGQQLERVFAEEARRNRPGALSVSGIRAQAICRDGDIRVRLWRTDGEPLAPEAPVSVVTTDMLAAGAVFSAVAPPTGVVIPPTAPIARIVVERWLRHRGGHLSESQFLDPDGLRWSSPSSPCAVH